MGNKRTQLDTEHSRKQAAKVNAKSKNVDDIAEAELSDGMGDFEDAWDDEIESEGERIDCKNEDAENMELEEANEPPEPRVKVYLPSQELEEGEELVHDASAYHMLHSMSSKWPCLSFDILPDNLGAGRSSYPHTIYSVAGTQADLASKNELYVMKMSQLNKTMQDGDDSDAESDDGLDDDPILEHREIPHHGGVNRIRVAPQQNGRTVAATWADTGNVHLWDLTAHLTALDVPGTVIPYDAARPLHTIENHAGVEGFAMDWSEVSAGRLLTGDVAGRIFLTTRTQTGYSTGAKAFTGHESSLEDLQFSPGEATVFASCSADGTIRIWDTRIASKKPVLGVKASDTDINVISWNKHSKVNYLLASGADDGEICVWDMRAFKPDYSRPTPYASFRWHNAPITSIEWSPHEESAFAAAGADDQVSIWDLSVEHDKEEKMEDNDEADVPPQLLFIHQGQKDIKEVHYHRHIPGAIMTTAGSGFNVFKPVNM